MSVLDLAYEHAIFQLIDLKIKKEVELSHHRHLKPSSHDLTKLIIKGLISRTKNNIININLAYKDIIINHSYE
jgi:hypothetical protein